jgi:hypothetical protein
VTSIASDPAIIGHAFLDCSDTLYTGRDGQILATVLLDATDPGSTPAALPGAKPLTGHPGVVAIPHGGPFLLGSNAYARRDRGAWLIVSGSGHAIRALNELTIANIDLHPPQITTTGPTGVACAIAYQPIAGLLETTQAPWRGPPPRWGPNPRLYPCTAVAFYLHNWPLEARVFAPIAEPGTPHRPKLHPIPGHPGDYAVAANGYTGPGIWRRYGRTWLTITGGRGKQQQITLINHLTVHHTPTT